GDELAAGAGAAAPPVLAARPRVFVAAARTSGFRASFPATARRRLVLGRRCLCSGGYVPVRRFAGERFVREWEDLAGTYPCIQSRAGGGTELRDFFDGVGGAGGGRRIGFVALALGRHPVAAIPGPGGVGWLRFDCS